MKKLFIVFLLLASLGFSQTFHLDYEEFLKKPLSFAGYLRADGTVPLTANWPAGNFALTIGSVILSNTGTLTSTAGNATFTTALTAATGNEVALTLNYTTNKATSGNDFGLVINMTDTASPGTSLLFDAQVGGVSKFKCSNNGSVTITSGFATPNGQILGYILRATTGGVIVDGGDVTISDRAITVGTGTGLTVNTAKAVIQQVYVATVTYAGFSAAATTADKTIATLPAKTKIVGFYANTTVAFTGGAVSATNLTVGKSAGGVEYIATHDVFTAAIVRGVADDADMGTELVRAAAFNGGGAIVNWAGTTTVSARITTTGANTDALTAGSVTFYIVTERY